MLFADKETLVAKLLSTKLFVGIGLISYSAYLWHQPLFAFARMRSIDAPNELLLLILVFISFILAVLSWKLIEQPFRRRGLIGQKYIFAAASLTGLLFTAFGLYGHFSKGYPTRLAVNKTLPNNFYELTLPLTPRMNTGLRGRLCMSETASICVLTSYPDAKTVLLVGDSHSADLHTPFLKYLRKNRISGYQMSVGGCGFIVSTYASHHGGCGKAVALLKRIITDIELDSVFFVTAMYRHARASNDLASDLSSFSELIRNISEKSNKVILFTPRFSLSHHSLKAAQFGQSEKLVVINGKFEDRVNQSFNALSELENVYLFNQRDFLIDLSGYKYEEFHGLSNDNTPLYRDTSHLTGIASEAVFNSLEKFMSN